LVQRQLEQLLKKIIDKTKKKIMKLKSKKKENEKKKRAVKLHKESNFLVEYVITPDLTG
jgi:phage terminase Nu1 subunit (DNA packaging protein)